jgi:hypothetical protein
MTESKHKEGPAPCVLKQVLNSIKGPIDVIMPGGGDKPHVTLLPKQRWVPGTADLSSESSTSSESLASTAGSVFFPFATTDNYRSNNISIRSHSKSVGEVWTFKDAGGLSWLTAPFAWESRKAWFCNDSGAQSIEVVDTIDIQVSPFDTSVYEVPSSQELKSIETCALKAVSNQSEDDIVRIVVKTITKWNQSEAVTLSDAYHKDAPAITIAHVRSKCFPTHIVVPTRSKSHGDYSNESSIEFVGTRYKHRLFQVVDASIRDGTPPQLTCETASATDEYRGHEETCLGPSPVGPFTIEFKPAVRVVVRMSTDTDYAIVRTTPLAV